MICQEMPEVPDVRILQCGQLPQHRMGIKVRSFRNSNDDMTEVNSGRTSSMFKTLLSQLQTYNNMEGGVVGRILSYYDLTDIPMSREERLQQKRDNEKQLRDQEIRKRALEKLKVESDIYHKTSVDKIIDKFSGNKIPSGYRKGRSTAMEDGDGDEEGGEGGQRGRWQDGQGQPADDHGAGLQDGQQSERTNVAAGKEK